MTALSRLRRRYAPFFCNVVVLLGKVANSPLFSVRFAVWLVRCLRAVAALLERCRLGRARVLVGVRSAMKRDKPMLSESKGATPEMRKLLWWSVYSLLHSCISAFAFHSRVDTELP